MSRGNVNGAASHLRDAFISSLDPEYVNIVLNDQEILGLIEKVSRMDSDELFKISQTIVQQVEGGMVPDEQMPRKELELTIYLLGIQDKILVKYPKTKTMNSGRHR